MVELNGDSRLGTADRLRYLWHNLLRNMSRAGNDRQQRQIVFRPPGITVSPAASPARALAESFIHYELPALVSPGRREILEIGCGSGRLASDLAALGYSGRYTGIDVGERFLQGALAQLERRFQRIDAHEYLPPQPLDLIVSNSVLEHIDRAGLLTRRLHCSLAPGGWQVHIVPAAWALPLFLWHGYRQYSLARIARESPTHGGRVYALGGIASFAVHFTMITIPETLLRLSLRKKLPGLYSRIMRAAINADRFGPRMPIMYAVCWPAAPQQPGTMTNQE